MSLPDVTPPTPPLRWRLLLAALGRLPQGALSRGMGRLADVRLPRSLRRPILGGFVRATGIDMSEAAEPLESYASIGHLFTRRLASGARTWPNDERVLGAPVDGVVGASGTVDDGTAVQAKGIGYRVADLLADERLARRFDGGRFVTLYLSPSHYHRIHAPCRGAVTEAAHVPGALLPVNAAAVASVRELFPRNERLLCVVDGPLGAVAVVAIGAYNVGRISAAFDPEWNGPRGAVTNRARAQVERRTYEDPPRVAAGDELMAFHLGSTVVVLTEPGAVEPTGPVRAGAEIRLGSPLARRAA